MPQSFRRQGLQPVHGASRLERAGYLQKFEFERDPSLKSAAIAHLHG